MVPRVAAQYLNLKHVLDHCSLTQKVQETVVGIPTPGGWEDLAVGGPAGCQGQGLRQDLQL
jgi:hypothetical protein